MSKKSYLSVFICAFISMNTSAAQEDSPFKWQTADGLKSFELGGFIRANYRDEHWESENNGKVLFDNARLNIKGKYDQFYLDTSYAFQDDHKRSIEHAVVGYQPNKQNDIQAGIIYKPFGIYPFPEHAWTFQIPFFLGFADSVAPGISWKHEQQPYTLTFAYMPTMSKGNLRYAPEAGSADDLDYVLPNQTQYVNEKRNQLNVRFARNMETTFGKQEYGLSTAYAQLHNKKTDKDGHYYALGLHALNHYGNWDFQSSIIHYQYDAKNPDGVEDDKILMQANGLTPAYLIAAEGTVGIFNMAYTQPVSSRYFPDLKSVKFYNDYSILKKDRSDWADSQMDTFGVQFNALPFLIWVDGSFGKNVNALGGAKNATGYTATHSDYSDEWKFRWNINIGYNF